MIGRIQDQLFSIHDGFEPASGRVGRGNIGKAPDEMLGPVHVLLKLGFGASWPSRKDKFRPEKQGYEDPQFHFLACDKGPNARNASEAKTVALVLAVIEEFELPSTS